MKIFLRACCLALCLVAGSASLGAVEIKQPDPALTAAAELKSQADKGDAQAQIDYAKSVYDTDKDAARSYARRAANQNNGEAWYWLGYTGLGTDAGVNYYERAAILGYADAFRHVFDDALFRAGAKANVAKAKKFADLARKMNLAIPDATITYRTIDLCHAAGSPAVPAADRPNSAERKMFSVNRNCSVLQEQAQAGRLSWNDYRLCVLSQRDLDGNALAEIYANGWGAKRNPQLAIAMLCHASSVPAELQIMVDEIYKTRDQAELERPFLFCDHVTSGMSSGVCAARRADAQEGRRSAEMQEYTAAFSAAQKMRFAELQKAAADYFNAHATSEQDLSGTMRAAIATEASEEMQNGFVQTLKRLEAGDDAAVQNFRQADRDMNRIYRRLLAQYVRPLSGTVNAEGIQATQRKFLTYRDTWVKFAAARYPRASSEKLLATLTEERVKVLENLAGEVEN